MRRVYLLVALVALVCGTAGNARAAISYQYVTDATNYNAAAAGAAVTANVYLEETVSGQDTSLIASENGLYAAGFGTMQTGTVPTGATTISNLNYNTQTEPAGFQGNTFKNVTPTQGYALEVTSNTDTIGGPSGATAGGSITPNADGSTTTKVFLGSISLTAGAAGTTTTFTIQSAKNLNPTQTDGNTLTFNNFYDLDQNGGSTQGAPVDWSGADNVINTFTVTVAAVPEPNGLMLSGLIGLPAAGLGVWMRRRKLMIAQA